MTYFYYSKTDKCWYWSRVDVGIDYSAEIHEYHGKYKVTVWYCHKHNVHEEIAKTLLEAKKAVLEKIIELLANAQDEVLCELVDLDGE